MVPREGWWGYLKKPRWPRFTTPAYCRWIHREGRGLVLPAVLLELILDVRTYKRTTEPSDGPARHNS